MFQPTKVLVQTSKKTIKCIDIPDQSHFLHKGMRCVSTRVGNIRQLGNIFLNYIRIDERRNSWIEELLALKSSEWRNEKFISTRIEIIIAMHRETTKISD